VSELRHVAAAVARRFLVLRHLLAPPRSLPPEPASVLRVVDRLGSLQFDPLEVAGRNHDLVLLARIRGYRREWTDHWLYEDRRLYETYNKSLNIVPVSELPWYRWIWDRARRRHDAAAFDDHAPLVEELLERIRHHGALLPRDVGPREAIDWYWRPTNQVRAILEALAEVGTLGIARREGNLRVYDLAERLFPREILAEQRPVRQQQLHRFLARYRGHGLLGASGNQELWVGGTGYAADRAAMRDELIDAGRLFPVTVEGIRGDSSPTAPRPGRSTRPWRSSRPWIRCAGTASCCVGCSASTTCGRYTCPRRNAAGATTCCRSSLATGSWGGSSRGSIGARVPSRSRRCGGSPVSIQLPSPHSSRHLPRRSGHTVTSRAPPASASLAAATGPSARSFGRSSGALVRAELRLRAPSRRGADQ
jgi:hypothetical protein